MMTWTVALGMYQIHTLLTLTAKVYPSNEKLYAVGRLLTVFNDKEVLDSLLTGWMRELQERGQFCFTTTHVLYHFCTLSLDVCSNLTSPEAKVHDVRFKSIGGGDLAGCIRCHVQDGASKEYTR